MPIMICSPVANFGDHPLVLIFTDESAEKWLQVWFKSCLLHEKSTLQGLKRYEKNPAKEIIKLTFDNNTANASS